MRLSRRIIVISALLILLPLLPPGSPLNTGDKTSESEGPEDIAEGVYLYLQGYQGDPKKYFPAGDYSGSYYIVQFDHPPTQRDKEALEGVGAEIHYYLPDYSFIVEISPGDVGVLEGVEGVRWVGPYLPSLRYNLSIFRELSEDNQILLSLYTGGAPPPFPDAVLADIYTFPGRAEEVARGLEGVGEVLEVYPIQIRAVIPLNRIEGVAVLDGVEWIEPAPLLKVRNDVAAVIMNVSGARSQMGLKGEGEIVAVCDSGLDTGVDNHSVNGDIHLDFDNRVIFFNLYGSSPDDRNGHGTHVSGSLAGNGARSSGRYAGMAPNATIIMQAAGDDYGSPYVYVTNFYNVLNQAYQNGARIHSDSWGSDDNGYYNGQSRYVDLFTWRYTNMTVFVAAGNTGPSASTVGSPATAKNIVAVGACGGYSVRNANNLASFSARGPTQDGRLKPDVVAPGTYITSCKSSLVGGNGYYFTTQGTSMATPLAAGVGTLIREYLRESGVQNPSAALIKALMLVGGREMTGSGASATIPNNSEGWGRVNITESISPAPPKTVLYRDVKDGLDTGETYVKEIYVHSSSAPLKIVVAWTDYPASLSSSVKLVNDLDLEVRGPGGEVYYGNDFTSPYNDTRDRRNNVEGVIINRPATGTYVVTVKGYNVPQSTQPFALAISGAISTPIGVVIINPRFISTEGGVATVNLDDSNLTGAGSATVTVTSTSDETGLMLTLTETPSGSGHFEGVFVVVNRTPNRALNEVMAADGDVVTATYTDSFPPGVRRGTALALDPPEIVSIEHDAPFSVLTAGDRVKITLRGSRGTSATARVFRGMQIFNVTLFDDGAHGDGLPLDGVYSNELQITSVMNGTYILEGTLNRYLLSVNATAPYPIVINQSAPRAPYNLRVEVDTRGEALNLTWDADSEYIEYFVLYRSEELYGPYSPVANISKHARYYKDTGLENGRTYYYALALFDTFRGWSGFSRIVSGVPRDLTGPIIEPIYPREGYTIGSLTPINLSLSADTALINLKYTRDGDRDGLPDENESWHEIGNLTPGELPYIWDTREEAGGPGEGDNITLLIQAWDFYNNSRGLKLVGLTVDNTPPGPPTLDDLPLIVNTTHLIAQGWAEPLGYVEAHLEGGERLNTTQVGELGIFIIEMDLPGEGVYSIRFSSYDRVWNGPAEEPSPHRVVVDLTPPQPLFTLPEVVSSGVLLTLDASQSGDSSPSEEYARVENYTWIIDDEEPVTLYGARAHYAFRYTGERSVTLLVRDAAGNWASLRREVTVMDSSPPAPRITGELLVIEDKIFSLSAEDTIDDDPTILTTGNFTWTLSDGGEVTFFGVEISYIYYTPGVYPATLKVTDSSGHYSVLHFNITVKDVTPPVARPPSKDTSLTNHPFLFDATASTDNDPTFYQTGNVTWSFEDGGEEVTLYGFQVVYHFKSFGAIQVTMTVKDAWGNYDVEVFQVLVAADNRPPEVLSYLPQTLEELPLRPTITLFFSEDMPWEGQEERVLMLDIRGGVVNVTRQHPSPDAISLMPTENLSLESTYTVVVPGDIKDWAGFPMKRNYTLTFTTLSYLHVTRVTPLDLDENITGKEVFEIYFNRALNSSSISTAFLKEHVRLLDHKGRAVRCTVEVAEPHILTLTPEKPLKAGEKYTLVVDGVLKDDMGIGMRETYRREFRVAAPQQGDWLHWEVAGIPALVWLIIMVAIGVGAVIGAVILLRKHREELNIAEEVGEGLYRTPKGEEFIFELDEEEEEGG